VPRYEEMSINSFYLASLYYITYMATKRSAAAISIERGFKHYSHVSYPWKVPAILSPCRVMLDSIQHQIQRKYSHTEYGSSTHCHLFPQLHPPLEQDSFQGLNIKKWPWLCFLRHKKKGPWMKLIKVQRNGKWAATPVLLFPLHSCDEASPHHTGDHQGGYSKWQQWTRVLNQQ